MKISIAKDRFTTKLVEKEMLWSELCARLAKTKRTKETMAEYLAMSKDEQLRIKDCGGFVGGSLINGRRTKESVGMRYCITLDLDNGVPGLCEKLEMENKYACCIYSTHKHTPENPRLRLVYYLAKPIMRRDYEAVARGLAEEIGLQYFDGTTFAAERLMFFPSTASDGIFYFKCLEGKPVDGDLYVKRAQEKQLEEISVQRSAGVKLTEAQEKLVKNIQPDEYLRMLKNKQEDPLTKKGIAGAFCRTYTVTQAIDKFLVGVYARTANPLRYNYIGGEGGPGVVVYDNDKFVYSFHATDKLSYKLMNAFDVVRRAKYGDSGVGSYKAMEKFALEDAAVKVRYEEEQEAAKQEKGIEKLKAQLDAGEPVCEENIQWFKLLDYTKSGELINSLKNMVTILSNDTKLSGIAYNEQFSSLWIKGEVPWPRLEDGFTEADFASLKHYFSKYYNLECGDKLYDAVLDVSKQRIFNPIKDYFAGLPTWDGVERVERILIDYLGAEDCEYTRKAMLKTLVAAVARVYQPGCKDDTMLILNGKQALGKSQLFKFLGGDWYVEGLSFNDMRDKTAAEKVSRHWIIEMAELDGIAKASWESVKAFLSRQKDSYRAVYERNVSEHKRRCIIVGTTNNFHYLEDTTGNRRFWPVDCTGNRIKSVWSMTKEEIDQIWAETLVHYNAGEHWWMEGELELVAEEKQQQAMVQDERIDLFEQYLDMYVPEYDWDDMNINERWAYIDKWFSEPYPDSLDGLVQRNVICNLEIFTEFFRKNEKDRNIDEKRAVKQMMSASGKWQWVPDDRKFFGRFKQQRYWKRGRNEEILDGYA